MIPYYNRQKIVALSCVCLLWQYNNKDVLLYYHWSRVFQKMLNLNFKERRAEIQISFKNKKFHIRAKSINI